MKLLILFFAIVLSSPGAVISVSPSSQSVTLGNQVTLDVAITGAQDVYAFQFDIAFDPAILEALSASQGTLLAGSGGFVPGTIDNGAGTVGFTIDSLIGPIPGINADGTLGQLLLSTLAAASLGSLGSPSCAVTRDSLAFLARSVRCCTIFGSMSTAITRPLSPVAAARCGIR